jgi:hypothetical protein
MTRIVAFALALLATSGYARNRIYSTADGNYVDGNLVASNDVSALTFTLEGATIEKWADVDATIGDDITDLRTGKTDVVTFGALSNRVAIMETGKVSQIDYDQTTVELSLLQAEVATNEYTRALWDAALAGYTNRAAGALQSNVWAAADSTTNYMALTEYLATLEGKLDSNIWASADSTTNYLPRTGGTMSGTLSAGDTDITGTLDVSDVATFAGNAVVESDLAVGGAVSFNAGSYSNFTSFAKPRIYRTVGTGTNYPFLTYDNLVIQSRATSPRDVIIAGGTPANTIATFVGASGNVGIGITTPSAKLQIAVEDDDSYNSFLQAGVGEASSDNIHFRAQTATGSGYEKETLLSSNFDYEGVGTTNAKDRADYGSAGIFLRGNQSDALAAIGFAVATTNSDYLNTKACLTQNGDFGIGTATPSAKLEVAGTLSAGDTEITGTLDVSDVATFDSNVIAPRVSDVNDNGVSGYQAMYQASECTYNGVSGGYVMQTATNCNYNAAHGYYAMYGANGCDLNGVSGSRAMYGAADCDQNGVIGFRVMYAGNGATNSLAAGSYAGRNATGTARGYIDCYTADPGSTHNPTNDLIFFDNGSLYLGRGTNSANKIVLRNLPTSDPGVAGQLWRVNSNLYISTGP